VPKAIDMITSLVRSHSCTHANLKDLVARELTLYGLLDACCRKCPTGTCEKKLNNTRLCVFVNRVFSSTSTSLLRVVLEIEATPSQYLRFPGGRTKQGSSWHSFDAFVVHPIYPKALPKYVDRLAPVEIGSPAESIDAAVSIHARVRAGRSAGLVVSMDIPVTLLPTAEREQLDKVSEIVEAGPMDLTAVVVGTSLKILLEDGWRWLKSRIPENSELISLDIGNVELTPDTGNRIAEAAKMMAPSINLATRDELMGYNNRLDHLARQKRYMLADVEGAASTIDKARTKAEIDKIDDEMDQVREKLFCLLQTRSDLHIRGSSGKSSSACAPES
jgi:hypothetical protein